MAKTPRIPKQFLGAFKAGHRPSAREYIDETFSWELLKKIQDSNWTDLEAIHALEYITRFNDEFHKNVIKKDGHALHSTDALRKSCYGRENSRNRDVMAILMEKVVSMDANTYNTDSDDTKADNTGKYHPDKNNRTYNQEDIVISILDHNIAEALKTERDLRTKIESSKKTKVNEITKVIKKSIN